MRTLSHAGFALTLSASVTVGQVVKLDWHPPRKTDINNLTTVINTDGVYGFIFNTSNIPDERYGAYNWCNMPHVRKTEYVKAPKEYELQYVEMVSCTTHVSFLRLLTRIHRFRDTIKGHHTRTTPFP